MPKPQQEKQLLKEQAWIGDAILALFAREWLLQQADISPNERIELFKQMTNNQFLTGLGEPTSVEAEIGRVYQDQGLQAAFDHISEYLLPLFQKQRRNRTKGNRGRK